MLGSHRSEVTEWTYGGRADADADDRTLCASFLVLNGGQAEEPSSLYHVAGASPYVVRCRTGGRRSPGHGKNINSGSVLSLCR